MNKSGFAVYMPVLRRLLMNTLAMDIIPPLPIKTVWCVIGTLREKKWDCMSSLLAPHFGTYSGTVEYHSGVWLKQRSTLADVLRGWTLPKIRSMSISISQPFGNVSKPRKSKVTPGHSLQSSIKTKPEQSTLEVVNQSVLPGLQQISGARTNERTLVQI